MNYTSERERRMATESIPRLFFSFSLPAIAGMMVQALYNIVDRFFIGQIPGTGSIAIGGIGVSLPITFILMGFTMLFGIGGGANISIQLGKKDQPMARKILANALIMLFLSALFLNGFMLLNLEKVLLIFGASAQNLPYASSYLRIILIGNYWNTFAFAFNHLIRAEGNPKFAMQSMLIGAITNIILDPIFIFVLDMGIAGAAYATIIAQFLSFLRGFSYYLGGKNIVNLKKEDFRLESKVIYMIVAIGISPFFIQIAGSVVGALLNNSLRIYGGALAQGAYAIINSIAMLFFMPIFGMNQGLQPIVGFNYGAGNFKRVKEAVAVGIISASTVMGLGWIVVQFFPHVLVGVMTPDPELFDITVKGLRIFLSMMFVAGFQIISSNFFQSIGKAKISFVLSLSRQVFLLAPLVYFLPRFFGLKGVWYAQPIADALSSLITLFFILREFRSLEWAHCQSNPLAEGCEENLEVLRAIKVQEKT
ncbi:MAG TPA: MATE family efflux transporter [Clostridia bacterium]|nr:MATE family efflux transporter [Clostridia bacterium]